LSACSTGFGYVDIDEGVFGLQRAFRIAGAKALLVSLWDVDSHATKFLMKAFYAHYTKGMSKYESLKQAQIETQKVYPSASNWAGFVLIGE
jgi:CHAT domain-containing protein